MNPPRLASFRYWRVAVPFREDWTGSKEFGGHPDKDRLILEAKDSQGNSGWGEGPWSMSPAEVKESLERLLQKNPAQIRSSFLDILWPPGHSAWQRPLPPSPFAPAVENLRLRLRHPLQVAVETALVDWQTRRLGLPFSAFFGGAWRDRSATDFWIGRCTPRDAARCVRRARKLGFRGLKIKTSLEDPNVERLEAIKSADAGFQVTVDANGRFHRFHDAWPTIKAMEKIGVMKILEDPFPRTALPETRELSRRLDARVVVHIDPPESLAQVIRAGCCGGLNLDSHVQGLFQWRQQAATADQFNLPVWHGSGLDLGIYTAAQLHLASSAPNCQLPGDQAGPWLRESTLVREKFQVIDGQVLVPPGSGLGITPDLRAIEKYSTASGQVRA